MSDDKKAPGARCAKCGGKRTAGQHPNSHAFVAPPSAEQGAVLTREEYADRLDDVDGREYVILFAHDAALRAALATEREARERAEQPRCDFHCGTDANRKEPKC